MFEGEIQVNGRGVVKLSPPRVCSSWGSVTHGYGGEGVRHTEPSEQITRRAEHMNRGTTTR